MLSRNVGLVYLLFILYDISVLMLAFLMTTFFDKARVKSYFYLIFEVYILNEYFACN